MTIDVDAYADDHEVDLYVLEPRLVYDPCIIDVVVLGSGEHVVVYDLNKSVGALMLEQGWARDESKEWLLFNAEQVMFDYQLQEKT
jgi:chemotaxis receptor (MCP) glutamine deamidase CheD